MSYKMKRILAVYGMFLLLSIGGIYWIYTAYFKVKPTCSDGIKNGIEEGIDCGGICKKICSFKAEDINVNWARQFQVSDGVYNIAASIENPNFNYALDVNYILRYFNEKNINLGEKKGTIHLEPLEKQILFFPGIVVGRQKIKRIFFDKDKVYNLEKSREKENKIIVNSKEITREKEFSRLKIILKNTDFLPHRHLQVLAVLFAKDGNVIEVNRTYLDYIDKNSEASVYMTWQKELPIEIANIKVILKEIKL